ncbi:MAG: hypothetical protein ACYDHX_17420 [Methanothrix sp.]
MNLPTDILTGLNRALSRHQHPEELDWRLVNDKWTAAEGDLRFAVIHDKKLGYVIAQSKTVSNDVGAECTSK